MTRSVPKTIFCCTLLVFIAVNGAVLVAQRWVSAVTEAAVTGRRSKITESLASLKRRDIEQEARERHKLKLEEASVYARLRISKLLGDDAADCLDIMQNFRNDEIEVTRTQMKESVGRMNETNYKRSFVTVTNTPKPFYVATHDAKIDEVRSDIMKNQFYYEKQLTARVVEIFEEKSAHGKESIMLDVGANIGWFSLVAAAHGATKVYSFEPNLQNTVRFCESLSLNRWLHDDRSRDVVTPIAKGVGSTESMQNLYEVDSSNPGSFSFKPPDVARTRVVGKMAITTLDSFAERHGWFKDKPTIALLKLDVERYEPQVLEGASKLLASKLVEKIAMELKPDQMQHEKQKIVKALFDAEYEFYMHGKWMGPDQKVPKIYDRWQDLLVDIQENKYGQNVMFRLRASTRSK